MQITHKKFYASFMSYAYCTKFSNNNFLLGNTRIYNSSLGSHTYITGGQISNAIIGSFCSIGPHVQIGNFAHHPLDNISTHPIFYSKRKQSGVCFTEENITFQEFFPVIIGSDVWIGAHVLILDGVTIGNGAVIAAGSVVTKDIEPFAIAGGVPAKVIRYRFSKSEIIELQRIKWWEHSDAQLKKLTYLFNTGNISELIKNLSS